MALFDGWSPRATTSKAKSLVYDHTGEYIMASGKHRFRTSSSSFIGYNSCGIVGFTDLVSNTVVLDNIFPLSRTSEILNGTVDLSFLPGIAHEAAHHLCLNSPVGFALCSLWQSSFKLWWEQIGTEGPQRPARDLAIASAANLLFQPLLEGIALFSEHDLFTGESPIISRVTQRVGALFSRGRRLLLLSGSPDVFRSLASRGGDVLFSACHTGLLRLARSSDDWTKRKHLLLSQSLKGANRSLLGYLAVKGMFAALISACPDFADPELFFVTVVRHFMHDQALVEILGRYRNEMDDPREADLALDIDMRDLLDRFQNLFDELYANPKAIAQAVAQSAPGGSRSGNDRPMSRTEFLLELRATGTVSIAWRSLMKHRPEFRFSFQRVLIRLSRDGQATIIDDTGQELFRVTTVEGCRPTRWEEDQSDVTFEGSIEAVQLRDLATFVVCVLGHDGLIAVFDCESGEWNLEERVKLLYDMPSAIAVEGAMHAFAEWQSRARDPNDIRAAIEDYERQANQAVERIYPQLVCRGWEANQRDRMTQAFDQRGVFSIYSEEDERRLTKLSLSAGLFSPLEFVAQVMELEKDELSRLVAHFNRTSKEACGFEPFTFTDQGILSRI
jgi:hypothetical protein